MFKSNPFFYGISNLNGDAIEYLANTAVGDSVTEDEVLCEIETDKVKTI